MKSVLVEVSARHLHLSRKDLDSLFGKDYSLKVLKQLTQPCDFAAEETVDLEIAGKRIEKLRIVGPIRENTQIEISLTDAILLGVNPPLRLSGDVENSSPAKLIGPMGSVDIAYGLIIAKRHLHCSDSEADSLGLKNNSVVSVKIDNERGVVFNNVIVRVNKDYRLCLHLDTDEGNAAFIDKKAQGEIL